MLPHLRKAASAQTTQSWHREVVTRYNNTRHPCFVVGMNVIYIFSEYRLEGKPGAGSRGNSIIKAYIKAVTVKALVVGLLLGFAGLPPGHVSGIAWAFV